MSTAAIKQAWNEATPAQRIEKFAASKAASRKQFDALSVMQQMLICLPL